MQRIATGTFAVGINLDGVLVHDGLPTPGVAQRFDWVAEAGLFDYVEINPPPREDFAPFLRASERSGVPIGVMGGIFCIGPDTLATFTQLNRQAGALGCRVFNCQVFDRASDGRPLALDEIGAFYLAALEIGTRHGCLPSLEVHVDMWLEQFQRAELLGEWLAQRGVPLRLTIDHSHLLFKLGNPEELALSGLAGTADQGHTLLHPASAASFYAQWLERGWIVHSHARSVQLNGRPNPLARRGAGADAARGRGIQYPFTAPAPGTYHQAWHEAELLPWKQALQQLLRWKAANPASALNQVSCEFIPFADYGGAARYSIFAQNVACAAWLRNEAQAAQLMHHS